MLPRGDTAFKAFVDAWLKGQEQNLHSIQQRWFESFVQTGPPHFDPIATPARPAPLYPPPRPPVSNHP